MTVAGTVIGRYQLLRLLAAGGMGEVYLARMRSSVEGFGALAAIKVLVRNLSTNQAFVRMFLEEARIVGRLHHKNIVQVRDVAEQDGQFFMVMEYIPGQNLRELLGDVSIQDRPLFEPRLGTEVFIEIVGALAAAHAEGLVHRDISPNNIMIGDEGVPKLIDFGVARALNSASLTTPGTLKGKFGYMAPEYVRGLAYDHRVDLFSLGVVMWETFARRRLFRGTSAAEQLHQVLEAEVPRLDQVVPGFPADLATIIDGTLERDPQRRISSAAMLGDALAEIARNLPPGNDATLRKWLERRLAGRIEDRRQTDQALLSLPPDAPVPDFAMAYPDAGSAPGTYGFHDAPRPTGTFATVQGGLASTPPAQRFSGQFDPPAAPPPAAPLPASAPAAPSAKIRGLAFGIAALLGVIVILLVSRRDTTPRSGDSPSAAVSALPGSAAPPSGSGLTPPAATPPDVSLAEAHRQIGLKAMADGDYTRARKEYEEAVHNGGGGDLPKLIEIASQLESDAQARPAVATATPPTTAKPAPAAPKPAPAAGPDSRSTTSRRPPTTRTPDAPGGTRVATRTEPAPARDKVIATHETPPPPAPEPPPPAAPALGTLVVTMSDDNQKGTVLLDGNVLGTTPLREPRIPVGEHQLVVRVGDQVLRSQKVLVTAIPNVVKVETLLPKATTVAARLPSTTTPPLPAPAPAAAPTPRVTADGDPRAGAGVVAGCNACHSKAGKSRFSARRYTRAQWERFFATGQHDRSVPLGGELSAAQMMAARAYLRANAADTAENQGAGILE